MITGLTSHGRVKLKLIGVPEKSVGFFIVWVLVQYFKLLLVWNFVSAVQKFIFVANGLLLECEQFK